VDVFPKTELKKSSFVIGEKFELHPSVWAKFTSNCDGISFDAL
jgi:hypothetical protein